MKVLSEDLRAGWSFIDELLIEAGVTFKGKQVVWVMHCRLHGPGHAITPTYIKASRIHHALQKRVLIGEIWAIPFGKSVDHGFRMQEPLRPHNVPSQPCPASDLFDINGPQFLLTVDTLWLISQNLFPATQSRKTKKNSRKTEKLHLQKRTTDIKEDYDHSSTAVISWQGQCNLRCNCKKMSFLHVS